MDATRADGDSRWLINRGLVVSQPGAARELELTVVILSWDGPDLTRRCVQAVRQHTRLPFELVIVDNGSREPVQRLVAELADRVVQNSINRGFSGGMNQGLQLARGTFVAFLNNDAVVPPAWDEYLISHLRDRDEVGMVVPAVTAAGNPVTVRQKPGTDVRTLTAFAEIPSAVVVVLRTAALRALGGWNEIYHPASAEDSDLAYTLWVNDLEVVLDERVLVEHLSKGTARIKFPRWRQMWHENGLLFLSRWASGEYPPARLPTCPEDVWSRNLTTASAAARAELASVRRRDRPVRRLVRNRLRPFVERLHTVRRSR